MAPDYEELVAEAEADFGAKLDARNSQYAEDLKRLDEQHRADIEGIEEARALALSSLEANATIEEA